MDRRAFQILIPLFLSLAPQAPSAAETPAWRDVPPRLQGILGPLEQDWESLDTERRRKWLSIAEGYERMTPGEQQNLLSRMRSWAKLSPEERRLARERYRDVLTRFLADGALDGLCQ